MIKLLIMGSGNKPEREFMKKYDLLETSRDFMWDKRFEIKEGCTRNAESGEELLESYESKEEALKAFSKHETRISEFSYGTRGFNVTEYAIEECEYDEDGDVVEVGDVIEVSKMKIEVCEKPSYKTLATFDNMEDAEYAMNNEIEPSDEYQELYISY